MFMEVPIVSETRFVEEFESYDDGIEVLSLRKALQKYDWIRQD